MRTPVLCAVLDTDEATQMNAEHVEARTRIAKHRLGGTEAIDKRDVITIDAVVTAVARRSLCARRVCFENTPAAFRAY